MNIIKYLLKSIFYTFFPRKCLFCGTILQKKEIKICSKCSELYLYPINIDKDLFFAPLRIFIDDICILSWYFVTKNAIKNFKFNNNIYIGKQLSKMLCNELETKQWINDIDYIVPVPLHKNRLISRGYNQSNIIAKVIGKYFNKTVCYNNLLRIKNNPPQALKKGFHRYDNVDNLFKLKDIYKFQNKNILLVDDVITTCSTIYSCCKSLVNVDGIHIYVACLASNRKII